MTDQELKMETMIITMGDVHRYLDFHRDGARPLHGIVNHAARWKYGLRYMGTIGNIPCPRGGEPIPCEDEVKQLARDLIVLSLAGVGEYNTREQMQSVFSVIRSPEFCLYASYLASMRDKKVKPGDEPFPYSEAQERLLRLCDKEHLPIKTWTQRF